MLTDDGHGGPPFFQRPASFDFSSSQRSFFPCLSNFFPEEKGAENEAAFDFTGIKNAGKIRKTDSGVIYADECCNTSVLHAISSLSALSLQKVIFEYAVSRVFVWAQRNTVCSLVLISGYSHFCMIHT
jgi:hypothetical protein